MMVPCGCWFLVILPKKWKLSMTNLTKISFSSGKFSIKSRESTERQICHLIIWQLVWASLYHSVSAACSRHSVLNIVSRQVSSEQPELFLRGSSIFRAKSCCQTLVACSQTRWDLWPAGIMEKNWRSVYCSCDESSLGQGICTTLFCGDLSSFNPASS